MPRRVSAGAYAAALVLTMAIAAGVEADDPERHSGILHSLSPAHGLLVIEETGANGQTQLVETQIRGAAVVRISRDPAHPWEGREQPTQLHRWAAGTFVVVIGRSDRSGLVNAQRVEIPAIERE